FFVTNFVPRIDKLSDDKRNWVVCTLKLWRQIFPLSVHSTNQIYLFLAGAAFDLFFSGNGGRDIFVHLVVNQLICVIALCEAFSQLQLMLGSPFDQVIRNTRIKDGSIGIGSDVHVIGHSIPHLTYSSLRGMPRA